MNSSATVALLNEIEVSELEITELSVDIYKNCCGKISQSE